MVIEDDDQDHTRSLLIKLLPHTVPRWHWWWWRWCWRLWWCWWWCPALGKSIPLGSMLTIWKTPRNGQSNLTTEFPSHTDGFAPYTQFNPQCSKLKPDPFCSPWWDWEHQKHPWGDSGLLCLLTHIAGQSCNNDSTVIKSSKAPWSPIHN